MLAGIEGITRCRTDDQRHRARGQGPGAQGRGLSRVTVSLDALDDDTFAAMNDVSFPVARVLDGIDAAARAGLSPVKINMVVKRGVNDDAVLAMADHFRHSGHILRFIEYMDVGTTNGWRLGRRRPGRRDLAKRSARDGRSSRSSATIRARSPAATATATEPARSA